MVTYNIGKEFSIDPSGRFYGDGKGNGEEFREERLAPMLRHLKDGELILIILDDEVTSYGSSFLVEGFAGIVKYGYMESDKLLKTLQFKYTDPDFEFYKDRIISYIKETPFNTDVYKKSK